MHEACYKLLTRCLTTKDTPEINKDVLYTVMQQNTQDLANSLNLYYGGIGGPEQFWECYAGEEWTVFDHGTKVRIEEVLESMLPARLFDPPATPPLDLTHKVRRDPLAVLPYDILHGIFAELSMKKTLRLMQASWHIFESTRDPAFWRLMIRVHIVPWFWELDGFLKNAIFPDAIDWKGMFQWLNEVTKGTYGMEGPLMSIANRRRIWDVCQQIAPLYHEKLGAAVYTEPSEEEAAAILSTARFFHMPKTMFPLPTETRAVRTQFVRSWSDIGYRACDFDTYWTDPYGGLVGISVDFGSGKRVFGSTEGTKGQSLRIKAGEWIKEIRMSLWQIETHMTNGDVKREAVSDRDDQRAVSWSFIDGMKVSYINLPRCEYWTDLMRPGAIDFWKRENTSRL